MRKIRMINFALQLLIAFTILISIAACNDEKTADQISAPISSSIVSSSPGPTPTIDNVVEPSPTVNESSDNSTPEPEKSISKNNPIKASAQPASTATAAAQSSAQESAASPSPIAASASPSAAPTEAATKGIMISITGDDKVGVILDATLVEVEGEVSVMTLLQKETRKEKIQMEFSGKGIFAYVKGIANLYEFDRGAKSGWLFKVNGVFADKGAGSYKVKAGDQVEWLYTLDLGKDVGAKR